MTYPIVVVDNFFEDPDAIVETATTYKYYPPETGNWPGARTKQLHIIDERFFHYFGEKLHLMFHDVTPDYWNMQMHFQKIQPFHKDQYDRKNRGWIHQDIDTFFGGVVYLNKDPDPDTGTSIYGTKKGYALQFKDEIQMKEDLYVGKDIDDTKYYEAWDRAHEQYVETVSVKNVYNRFLMFNNKTHHGVQTFGTKERLTLNFFVFSMTGKIPPILRSR